MTAGKPAPARVRQAAVDDYRTSGDTYAIVAARHGVSRGALHSWVNPNGGRKRNRKTWDEAEVAYVGGWENRGGVLYPLFPERRSA